MKAPKLRVVGIALLIVSLCVGIAIQTFGPGLVRTDEHLTTPPAIAARSGLVVGRVTHIYLRRMVPLAAVGAAGLVCLYSSRKEATVFAQDAMHALFSILMVVLLADITAGLVLQHMLYSRLIIAHPKVLELLAESSAGIMAFQRYLWKRRYIGLGDELLTRRADALRRYWIICFLFFSLVVVTLVVAVTI